MIIPCLSWYHTVYDKRPVVPFSVHMTKSVYGPPSVCTLCEHKSPSHVADQTSFPEMSAAGRECCSAGLRLSV